MKIEALHYTAEDMRMVPAESLTLSPGTGIRGDWGKGREDGRITLMAGEAELFPRYEDGLCVRRFRANLITRGLDYSALRPGMRLAAGGAELVIERVGKRCFAECPLRQRGEVCPLPQSVAFAAVGKAGVVAVGDEIASE